jgi:hypothetical protein
VSVTTTSQARAAIFRGADQPQQLADVQLGPLRPTT